MKVQRKDKLLSWTSEIWLIVPKLRESTAETKDDYARSCRMFRLFNLLSSWLYQKPWDIQLQPSSLFNLQQSFQLLSTVRQTPSPSPLHISFVSATRAGLSRNSGLCLNTHLDSRGQFVIVWDSRVWEVLFELEEVVDSCYSVVKICWN
jgi:hypothetical protein